MKKFSKILSVLVAGTMISSIAAIPVSAADPGITENSATLSFTKDFVIVKDGTVPNETFEFTMTPMDASDYEGPAPEGLTQYTGADLTAAADTTGLTAELAFSAADSTAATVINNNTQEQIEKTGSFDLSYLESQNLAVGAYYYEVTETEGSIGSITYDDTVYQVEVVINNEGKISYIKSIADINGKWGKKPITFTNTCETDTLTIKKVVTGSAGDKTGHFTFSIDIPVGDNSESGNSYLVLKEGTEISGTIYHQEADAEPITIIVGTPKEFTLADGESLVISGVPENMIYKVSEIKNADGTVIADETTHEYTCKITGTFTTANSSLSEAVDGYTWDATKTGKDTPIVHGGNTITFTNNKEVVSPTGIALNLAPYAAAILVAVLGAVALFVRKRNSAK